MCPHREVITDGLDQGSGDERAHDRVEVPPFRDVAEDGRAERRAVQCAILHNPREGPVERPRAARAWLCRSCTSWSQSITATFFVRNQAVTVDLPVAIPPVKPTSSISGFWLLVLLQLSAAEAV